MSVPSLGRHKSFASFAAHLAEAAPSLVADEHLLGDGGPLGSRLAVGSLQIPNRWAIHPMEGWDGTSDGRPTAWTLRPNIPICSVTWLQSCSLPTSFNTSTNLTRIALMRVAISLQLS